MPVFHLKAVPLSDRSSQIADTPRSLMDPLFECDKLFHTDNSYYPCPVYRSAKRGAENVVFTVPLQVPQSTEMAWKWVLRGTALLISPDWSVETKLSHSL